jgi:uncharacterized membrane protein (Fun14 family)
MLELLRVNLNFNDTLLKIGSGDVVTVVYAIRTKSLNFVLSGVLALFTIRVAVLQYMGDKTNNGLWTSRDLRPRESAARRLSLRT